MRVCRDVTSTQLAAPAQEAIRLVDPAVLRGHLCNTRGAKAQAAEGEANDGVDDIIVKRQQRAAEQSEMDEADRGAEDQRINGDLPPRPPGFGDGAAGERRS